MAAGSSGSAGRSASRPATRPEPARRRWSTSTTSGWQHKSSRRPSPKNASSGAFTSQTMMVARKPYQKLSIVKSSTIQLVR